MPNYRLLVFKPYEKGDVNGKYRLVLIDPNNDKGYPANFVCLLPRRLFEKGKPLSIFAQKFGENCVDYAIRLLDEAISLEVDLEVLAELNRRLRLLKIDNCSRIRRSDSLMVGEVQVSFVGLS